MKCSCKDWKENIDKMNSAWALDYVHGGVGYTGKPIVFCPWCSKKLKKEKAKKLKLPIVSMTKQMPLDSKLYTNVEPSTYINGKPETYINGKPETYRK